ncbi:LOW QUALITY PROTEIN: uncharacterized protein LOC143289192 [Babylonia areolata]|uniref:LOW QUALITY PROTEIN: uncharacterized protein LOC143289192 n=1 Tax=Babylonia areolata TaxID=304850 RepID=UPI003FD09EC6
MSAFSASGRKEDVSLKLRAQNMKNAKDTTKVLEQENRKMEERLRELKMAMNREKEERERQGGGFWQRGQTGTLNSYATEVLHDKTNKSSKKKGVKVLKDEPLDVPRRNSGPGTIKYIAQRSPGVDPAREARNKGPKCGQCEDRAASLTCVQCSENYCAGCFAAFHLKGALKRHRTIPLHATGPRQYMSPRPTPPASSRSSVSGGATSGDVVNQLSSRSSTGGASGAENGEGQQSSGGSSLLNGAYNEADSAASFQQALRAWRQGDSTASNSDPKPRQPPPRQAVVVSPVKSPVMMVEHSTSTSGDQREGGGGPGVPEVKSAPHSLSYAQRLMLKQHRRTDLGHLPSPRLTSAHSTLTSSSSSPSSRLTSCHPGPQLRGEGWRGVGSDDDEDDLEDGERVDFQSLFEAVSNSSQQGTNRVTISDLTVVDVTHSAQQSAGAEVHSCTVQEVSSVLTGDMDPQYRTAEKEEDSSSSSQARRLSKSRETTRVIEKRTRVPRSREVTHVVDHPRVEEPIASADASLNKNQSHTPSSRQSTQVLSSKVSLGELPVVEEGDKPDLKKKPPPAASAPRPKSVKSRPASARAKSARSRPSSRAHSRAGSRMEVEGVLTKAPTSALSQIARRTAESSATQYHSPMEGFFLAGVKVEDQVTGSGSRPVTPAQVGGSRSRPVTPAHMEKLKVSNKLYAMSPRSWRPESSVGDSVPATGSPSPSVVRYTYSGQLDGQPLAWNPQDSVSTPVPPEEEAPTPTLTPTPTTSGHRRAVVTPDPNARPFSAQKPEWEGRNPLRPNSCTGGAEPSKRQRRKLPSIDNDLDGDKRERARRQKQGGDGWTGDEDQPDPAIRALSASRTRSWVASQNSLQPGSSRWETEVQDFVLDSTDLDLEGEVTPRPQSGQSTVGSSARSAVNQDVEDSGRMSRAVVMDGEDLSKYDEDCSLVRVQQNSDDKDTLDRLEWELASESGRITAEGKISRMSALDLEDDGRSSGSRSSSSTLRLSYDQGYDINSKLKDDELSDDDKEQRAGSCMGISDEQEVRALK